MERILRCRDGAEKVKVGSPRTYTLTRPSQPGTALKEAAPRVGPVGPEPQRSGPTSGGVNLEGPPPQYGRTSGTSATPGPSIEGFLRFMRESLRSRARRVSLARERKLQ